MPEYERVKRVVLGTEDPTERKLRFLALLTSSLPKAKGKPVLTGGSAIEIYLDGMLRTGDMDIIYNVAALKKILKKWHFELGSALRSYYNEDLGLAVDLVGDRLSGSNDKVTTITTEYGPVTVVGIEDLILKRLASAKFWKVPTDMEQSYLLARSQQDRMDWDYLESEAKKRDIADYLRKLRKLLEKNIR
ncbi:MAG: hypothetical protein JRN20_07715 [Nitrososphaerota archaeon]|nr:hypothetical protein [Nitrososphaerota archaeon]MDG6923808.1 hypothetical protein [Nitrososphaerota archaeon]